MHTPILYLACLADVQYEYIIENGLLTTCIYSQEMTFRLVAHYSMLMLFSNSLTFSKPA